MPFQDENVLNQATKAEDCIWRGQKLGLQHFGIYDARHFCTFSLLKILALPKEQFDKLTFYKIFTVYFISLRNISTDENDGIKYILFSVPLRGNCTSTTCSLKDWLLGPNLQKHIYRQCREKQQRKHCALESGELSLASLFRCFLIVGPWLGYPYV